MTSLREKAQKAVDDYTLRNNQGVLGTPERDGIVDAVLAVIFDTVYNDETNPRLGVTELRFIVEEQKITFKKLKAENERIKSEIREIAEEAEHIPWYVVKTKKFN